MKKPALRASVVDFTAMAYGGCKDNQLIIPDLTQNTIVPHPIAPELAQLTFEWLPRLTRIGGNSNA